MELNEWKTHVLESHNYFLKHGKMKELFSPATKCIVSTAKDLQNDKLAIGKVNFLKAHDIDLERMQKAYFFEMCEKAIELQRSGQFDDNKEMVKFINEVRELHSEGNLDESKGKYLNPFFDGFDEASFGAAWKKHFNNFVMKYRQLGRLPDKKTKEYLWFLLQKNSAERNRLPLWQLECFRNEAIHLTQISERDQWFIDAQDWITFYKTNQNVPPYDSKAGVWMMNTLKEHSAGKLTDSQLNFFLDRDIDLNKLKSKTFNQSLKINDLEKKIDDNFVQVVNRIKDYQSEYKKLPLPAHDLGKLYADICLQIVENELPSLNASYLKKRGVYPDEKLIRRYTVNTQIDSLQEEKQQQTKKTKEFSTLSFTEKAKLAAKVLAAYKNSTIDQALKEWINNVTNLLSQGILNRPQTEILMQTFVNILDVRISLKELLLNPSYPLSLFQHRVDNLVDFVQRRKRFPAHTNRLHSFYVILIELYQSQELKFEDRNYIDQHPVVFLGQKIPLLKLLTARTEIEPLWLLQIYAVAYYFSTNSSDKENEATIRSLFRKTADSIKNNKLSTLEQKFLEDNAIELKNMKISLLDFFLDRRKPMEDTKGKIDQMDQGESISPAFLSLVNQTMATIEETNKYPIENSDCYLFIQDYASKIAQDKLGSEYVQVLKNKTVIYKGQEISLYDVIKAANHFTTIWVLSAIALQTRLGEPGNITKKDHHVNNWRYLMKSYIKSHELKLKKLQFLDALMIPGDKEENSVLDYLLSGFSDQESWKIHLEYSIDLINESNAVPLDNTRFSPFIRDMYVAFIENKLKATQTAILKEKAVIINKKGISLVEILHRQFGDGSEITKLQLKTDEKAPAQKKGRKHSPHTMDANAIVAYYERNKKLPTNGSRLYEKYMELSKLNQKGKLGKRIINLFAKNGIDINTPHAEINWQCRLKQFVEYVKENDCLPNEDHPLSKWYQASIKRYETKTMKPVKRVELFKENVLSLPQVPKPKRKTSKTPVKKETNTKPITKKEENKKKEKKGMFSSIMKFFKR